MKRLSLPHVLPIYRHLLFFGVVMACLWWLVGYTLRTRSTALLVWDDQQSTFLDINVYTPYEEIGFINPPHTVLWLAPLQPLGLYAGVAVQMGLWCVGLAWLTVRFKAKQPYWSAFISLTSVFMLDNALELNIDWLIVWGLLVPPPYSAPLLLVKPQSALGYLFGFRWGVWWRWGLVALLTFALTLVLWGNWIPEWLANIEGRSWMFDHVNASPVRLIGTVPAFLLGSVLLAWAFWKQDSLIGVVGGVFFVPYVTIYSLHLQFTLLAIRFPRMMGGLSLAFWAVVVLVLTTLPL